MEKITLNGFETVFDVLTPGPKNESETEKTEIPDIYNTLTKEQKKQNSICRKRVYLD